MAGIKTTAGVNLIADTTATLFNAIQLLNDVGSNLGIEDAVGWTDASDGVITLTSTHEFNITSGATVGSFAILNESGGIYETIEEFDVADYTYTEDGRFTITSGTYTFS